MPGLVSLYVQLLRAAVRKGKVPKKLTGHKEVTVSSQPRAVGGSLRAGQAQQRVRMRRSIPSVVCRAAISASACCANFVLLVKAPPVHSGAAPPPLQVRVAAPVAFDAARYASFLRLVGFDGPPKDAPLTYPIAESFRLSMLAMSHPDFPFNVLGSVLARNRTEVKRPLASDEELLYRCGARPSPGGAAAKLDGRTPLRAQAARLRGAQRCPVIQFRSLLGARAPRTCLAAARCRRAAARPRPRCAPARCPAPHLSASDASCQPHSPPHGRIDSLPLPHCCQPCAHQEQP